MTDFKNESSTELFRIVRTYLLPDLPREALAEIEERWHSGRTGNPASNVSLRLARVEEDLAEFKRAHDGHVHEYGPVFRHTSSPLPEKQKNPLDDFPPLVGQGQITDMRNNSENRAWQCFEDWRALEIKKPENAGNVYEVRIKPPVSADDWDAEIWFTFYSDLAHDGRGGTVRDLVVSKRGTSRVDALAHLASWCQAEMPETPRDRTCGTCNGRERDHDGADHPFNPDHKDNRPAIR